MQDPEPRLRRRIAFVLALLTGVLMVSLAPGVAHASACTAQVLEAERSLDIPRGLLLAISLVESGQDGEPKPLALNVAGHGIYATSVRQAEREMHDAHGRLRTDVAVGCMQLSLALHAHAFQPISKILDPAANVWFAARYLAHLRRQTGSWTEAVANYNGAVTRAQKHAYLCKVRLHLAALNENTAALIDARNCTPHTAPIISAETRQAFQNAELAELD